MPSTVNEGRRFLIPSQCSDCGGRIFTFETQSDLYRLSAYYASLGKPGEPGFSWVLVRDNVLVQIDGRLPEAKAAKYDQALERLEASNRLR